MQHSDLSSIFLESLEHFIELYLVNCILELLISILSKRFRCSNESNQKAIRDLSSKVEMPSLFRSECRPRRGGSCFRGSKQGTRSLISAMSAGHLDDILRSAPQTVWRAESCYTDQGWKWGDSSCYCFYVLHKHMCLPSSPSFLRGNLILSAKSYEQRLWKWCPGCPGRT